MQECGLWSCEQSQEGRDGSCTHAGPSGKHMAGTDPHRMFLKQLLGGAGAF